MVKNQAVCLIDKKVSHSILCDTFSLVAIGRKCGLITPNYFTLGNSKP